MCLAIPGEILSLTDDRPMTRSGKVSFGGVVKDINLAYVPEAQVGNFVIVHVGFALSVIDADEAQQVFEHLDQIAQMEEAAP